MNLAPDPQRSVALRRARQDLNRPRSRYGRLSSGRASSRSGVPGSQHEDGRVLLAATETPSDLESAEIREADIEDDDIDPVRFGQLQPGFAVHRDIHDVTILLEQSLEDPPETLVVLDDEEVHRRGRSLVREGRAASSARW